MSKKRRMLARATRGIMTTVLIASASTTFAQTIPSTNATRHVPQNLSRIVSSNKTSSGTTLDTLVAEFGLNANDFKEELRAGKTPKEVLADQGFTAAHIQKIFKTSSKRSPPPSIED